MNLALTKTILSYVMQLIQNKLRFACQKIIVILTVLQIIDYEDYFTTMSRHKLQHFAYTTTVHTKKEQTMPILQNTQGENLQNFVAQPMPSLANQQ